MAAASGRQACPEIKDEILRQHLEPFITKHNFLAYGMDYDKCKLEPHLLAPHGTMLKQLIDAGITSLKQSQATKVFGDIFVDKAATGDQGFADPEKAFEWSENNAKRIRVMLRHVTQAISKSKAPGATRTPWLQLMGLAPLVEVKEE